MGTGTESGKSNALSAIQKMQITKGIQTHSSEATDKAMNTLQANIQKEQGIIANYDKYVKSGYITGPTDPWWVGHKDTLATLKAKYAYFEKERKRLGK